MDRESLKDQLRIDEGVRQFPYVDTRGKITVGVGHNLTDNGLSDDEINYLLDNDIDHAVDELDKNFSWWRAMTDNRQQALTNFCFNVGIGTVLTFKNTMAHMQAGDYQAAANSILQSKWALQVHDRANRIADQIRNG